MNNQLKTINDLNVFLEKLSGIGCHSFLEDAFNSTYHGIIYKGNERYVSIKLILMNFPDGVVSVLPDIQRCSIVNKYDDTGVMSYYIIGMDDKQIQNARSKSEAEYKQALLNSKNKLESEFNFKEANDAVKHEIQSDAVAVYNAKMKDLARGWDKVKIMNGRLLRSVGCLDKDTEYFTKIMSELEELEARYAK